MRPIEITGTTLCVPAQGIILAPLKIQRVGKKTVFTTLLNPVLQGDKWCYTITPDLSTMKHGRYDGTFIGLNCASCVPLYISCK